MRKTELSECFSKFKVQSLNLKSIMLGLGQTLRLLPYIMCAILENVGKNIKYL